MYKLNTYYCVSNPTVHSTITASEWLSSIKKNHYYKIIESARKGESDYNTVKETLPCVTYNFTYSGYKKDTNIISSTGLIYIDGLKPAFEYLFY